MLKRFASIADPTQIVARRSSSTKGPVKIEATERSGQAARVVRRRGLGLLFLPLLELRGRLRRHVRRAARAARTSPATNSRLSFPLTWGGDRSAQARAREDLRPRPADARASRRVDLATDESVFRRRRRPRSRCGCAPSATITRVAARRRDRRLAARGRSSSASDSFTHAGADVTFDTRLDPMLARNAVYGARVGRALRLHARGARQPEPSSTAAATSASSARTCSSCARCARTADVPLPPYLQPMLGGMANLRGFRAGSAIGDTLVAGIGRTPRAAHVAAQHRQGRRQRVRRHRRRLRQGRAARRSALLARRRRRRLVRGHRRPPQPRRRARHRRAARACTSEPPSAFRWCSVIR